MYAVGYDVGGSLSATIVKATVNDKSIVTENEILSLDPGGNRNVKPFICVKMLIGSSIYRRLKVGLRLKIIVYLINGTERISIVTGMPLSISQIPFSDR